jgi:hypothetical protein
MKKSNVICSDIVAVLAGVLMLSAIGCGETVPTNAEELKNIQNKPSNNPDIKPIDAANTEFGGKGPKVKGGG